MCLPLLRSFPPLWVKPVFWETNGFFPPFSPFQGDMGKAMKLEKLMKQMGDGKKGYHTIAGGNNNYLAGNHSTTNGTLGGGRSKL